MNQILTLDSVQFSIGKKQVLDNVSLQLPEGQIMALLGTNGAGKSTLMHLALGLVKPKCGTIDVLGCAPHKGGRKLRERVTFVPAIPDVYPWMTARDLFRFLRPQYPLWNQSMAEEDCDLLQVPNNVPFAKMSRGQAMKAMVISALAPHPKLLLLDEPFGGLDPNAKEDLLASLLRRVESAGQSILIATHQLDVAARLADRVVVLQDGKVSRQGPVEDLLPERTPPQPVPKGLHGLLREADQQSEAAQ